MDHFHALAELPEAHAVALRLTETGEGEAAVARALGIEVEAVRPLLDVARAKLHALVIGDDARRPLAFQTGDPGEDG